jgi:hypothetical protein
METKTKSGFTVIQMVEIPIKFLREGVLRVLNGRETYSDTDSDINEKVYNGDVFDAILNEQDGLSSGMQINAADRKQIEELASDFKDYELIRVNKI